MSFYRPIDLAPATNALESVPSKNAEHPPVALYENGRYAEAKREMRAALPFIEVTPDVERYRVKIEGAIE